MFSVCVCVCVCVHACMHACICACVFVTNMSVARRCLLAFCMFIRACHVKFSNTVLMAQCIA